MSSDLYDQDDECCPPGNYCTECTPADLLRDVEDIMYKAYFGLPQEDERPRGKGRTVARVLILLFSLGLSAIVAYELGNVLVQLLKGIPR